MRPKQFGQTVYIKTPFDKMLIDLNSLVEKGEQIQFDELQGIAFYYSKKYKMPRKDILSHITTFAQEAGFSYDKTTMILTRVNGVELKHEYKNSSLLTLMGMMIMFSVTVTFGISRLYTFW